jgi:putative aldouronate transport system substrate-binding protein
MDVTKGSDLNQLQVLLASDMLPDIVFTENQINRFQNPDVSFPWDELMAQYAPEFKDLVDPVEVVNNTYEDGHFYTLTSHYISNKDWVNPHSLLSNGSPGFYYREDIMNELGNPSLQSFDDLVNVFKMVKEKYPDMTAFLPSWGWGDALMQFMGLQDPTQPYLKEDGTVGIGLSQPDMIEYYLFFNKLVREGYLSKETFTLKSSQWSQIMYTGNVFAAQRNCYVQDQMNLYYDSNGIKAKLKPLLNPLKFKGEDKYKLLDTGIGWSSTFITKKCQNPERAIRFMEFLKSPEGDKLTQWGVEGLHYTLTPEGLPKYAPGFEKVDEAKTGIGGWYFQASGLGEGQRDFATTINNPKYSSRVDLMKFIKAHVERIPALNFTQPLADSEEAIIAVGINDLLANAAVGVITAPTEEEARANFAKMLADAEKIGLSKLEAYKTQAYLKVKPRYDAIK